MPVLEAAKAIEALNLAQCCGRASLLQTAAEEIRKAGVPYSSVYLYMLRNAGQQQVLLLEAFSGRPTQHTTIQVGHGVCGTAVALAADQNVGNVKERENYIACNLFTQSELVVLIRKLGVVIGQIDIDSDQLHPFSAEEQSAVRQVADALGALL